MSEPYVGEIRLFAGNFAPHGWAFCDGQLLAVSQNDALFSLLGTIYGGDGRTSFGLPDLRGRVPIHHGQGLGLSSRRLGAAGGAEQVTLTSSNLPSHTHQIQVASSAGDRSNPAGNWLAQSPSMDLYVEDSVDTPLAASSISGVGGGRAHDNVAPFQCIHYIIALVGVYPSRN